MSLTFGFKIALMLIGVIPFLILAVMLRHKLPDYTMLLPTSGTFKRIRKGKPIFWRRELISILRVIAIVLIIIAAARPQLGRGEETTISEGIDIALCLDVSGSMLAEDFTPNRLEAAKDVVKKFVREMDGNRLGLVAFAGKSFTQCPLTTDYHIIEQLIDDLDTGTIPINGTAIGDAIGNAINKFVDEKAKSKVIILLTDGENNTGIDPEIISKVAFDKDIRIYVIGVGTPGGAPVPHFDHLGRKSYYRQGSQLLKTHLEEEPLQRIASLTKGKYYRATDNTSLRQIYQEIAQLEKHEIETREYTIYNELYGYFLVPGLCFLFLEMFLFTGRFRRLI